MALIEKQKGRRADQSPSGYTRIFGIDQLGQLMSRVHGAVISAGTELERMIWERVNQVKDLDAFLEENRTTTKEELKDRIWVAHKKQVKKSKIINSKYEPDFLAFDLKNRNCFILEIKDGDQFDTKKASGEHTTLHNFANDISRELSFSTRIYLCAFNALTIDDMYIGLKGKFAKKELITGKNLCLVFGIDYDEIVRTRSNDQQSNLDYFVKELLRIDNIRAMIIKRLKGYLKKLKK